VFASVEGLTLPFKANEPLYGTVAPQTEDSAASQVAEDIFKQLF